MLIKCRYHLMIRVNATLTPSNNRSNKRGNASIVDGFAAVLRSSHIMDLHVRSGASQRQPFSVPV